MDEKKELKEVMTIGYYGLCPICGSLMGMLESHYNMYGLTPHGKYPNRLLESEQDITYACTCGYRCAMVKTVDGILPKNHEDVQKMNTGENLSHVIGYVEDENKNG